MVYCESTSPFHPRGGCADEAVCEWEGTGAIKIATVRAEGGCGYSLLLLVLVMFLLDALRPEEITCIDVKNSHNFPVMETFTSA